MLVFHADVIGRVGIKGHAVAEAVAEAPKGVARALLYIVRASPSFLLHPSFKTFYHTFHQGDLHIRGSSHAHQFFLDIVESLLDSHDLGG